MDAYAKPGERKLGAQRPRIEHLPQNEARSTRRERQLHKEQIAAERRAIKKSARRHLQRQLQRDLDDTTSD